MKRSVLIIMAFCILLTGCTGKYKNEVNAALDALKIEWSALYNEYESVWGEDVEDFIEIENTKVWIIRNTVEDEFQKIDYLIEFDIKNEIDARGYNFVAIYNDESVKVLGSSPFDLYTLRTESDDFSHVVDGEEDLKNKYNGKIELE